MVEDIESTTLTQRLVLLGVATLADRGETPAHSSAVKRACLGCLDDVKGDVVGGLSEAEVMRALNQLEAGGLVDRVAVENPSPVGKGRPMYRLGPDPSTVLDDLAADDRVTRVVENLRGE